MQHTNATKTSRLPSLIETLNQGFTAVNRRPWVLAIPLLLDLFYWLGPRISPQPFLDRLVSVIKALNPQAWTPQSQQVIDQLAHVNAPVDLSPFGVFNIDILPKFINIVTPLISTPPPPITPTTWHIGSFGTLLGAFALINLAGLIAASIFLVPLADVIRGNADPQPRLRRFARVFGSFLGIALVFLGISLVVGVPFVVMAGFITLVSPAGGQLVALFWVTLFLWLLFTASFSFDAVVVSGAGPLRALLTSLYIVQRSFWGAFGLFALGWLIIAGMSIIWQMLSGSAAGLVIAMVGSAYITSGLAAAHLVFYRDRLSRVTRRI